MLCAPRNGFDDGFCGAGIVMLQASGQHGCSGSALGERRKAYAVA
jgi:hypothetical protein